MTIWTSFANYDGRSKKGLQYEVDTMRSRGKNNSLIIGDEKIKQNEANAGMFICKEERGLWKDFLNPVEFDLNVVIGENSKL